MSQNELKAFSPLKAVQNFRNQPNANIFTYQKNFIKSIWLIYQLRKNSLWKKTLHGKVRKWEKDWRRRTLERQKLIYTFWFGGNKVRGTRKLLHTLLELRNSTITSSILTSLSVESHRHTGASWIETFQEKDSAFIHALAFACPPFIPSGLFLCWSKEKKWMLSIQTMSHFFT